MSGQSTLGVVIRRRRLELGWTQEELAERISADSEYVRQSEISRIESGRIALPRRERLQRLAIVLDLPLGELLARSGWAGAEPHFSLSATDAIATHMQAASSSDVHESLQGSHATSFVAGQLSPPNVVRSQLTTRGYDPDAMAAFRHALATMRDESDRLQHNRATASVMQRQFHQLTDAEPAESSGVNYSDSAVG